MEGIRQTRDPRNTAWGERMEDVWLWWLEERRRQEGRWQRALRCGNGEAAPSARSVGSAAARRWERAGGSPSPKAGAAEPRRRLPRDIVNAFLVGKGQGRRASTRDRWGQAGPASEPG